jgi:hypothetical protein
MLEFCSTFAVAAEPPPLLLLLLLLLLSIIAVASAPPPPAIVTADACDRLSTQQCSTKMNLEPACRTIYSRRFASSLQGTAAAHTLLNLTLPFHIPLIFSSALQWTPCMHTITNRRIFSIVLCLMPSCFSCGYKNGFVVAQAIQRARIVLAVIL